MFKVGKPCKKCPWAEKGQPLITEELKKSNTGNAWFCCHINMGTCYGAENIKQNKDGKSK